MRISRLYTPQPLQAEADVVLDARTGHYLQRVLRLRPGDGLVLFNGDGADYAAEFVGGPKEAIVVRVNAKLPAVPESPVPLTLVQAVGKGDRMDYALQKATELGVGAFQPLFTERTDVRLDGARLERRMAHWQGVVVAAAEQSGRASLPELRPALQLSAWLDEPRPADAPVRLVLAPGAERSLAGFAADTLLRVGAGQGAGMIAGQSPSTSPVPVPPAGGFAVVVGPEGGWSEREVMALEAAGCVAVQLGPRVLRTETAGPAAVAVLQAIAGDFAPG